MGLLERIAAKQARITGGRKGFSQPPFWSLDQMRFALMSSVSPDAETIENDFLGYVEGAYKRNGVVFACVRSRMMVFSQAEFQWQRRRDRNLFGDASLSILERPWPGGTTGDLLARMEVDASLAGNSYLTITDDRGRFAAAATGPGRRIVHMRPDWVTIVVRAPSGDPLGLDARVAGYLYEPNRIGVNRDPTPGKAVLLLPEQVSHYAPSPDPAARWRGMSWLTPVLEDISADKAGTRHKRKFFENGAALNTVVTLDKDIGTEAFKFFVNNFKEQHRGPESAYETLFLGGGADAKVVSADMKQLDFKSITGAAETRVAAASGAHPVIVGLSEGMQGSSLNAGNFGQAKRLFVDGTVRHLWQNAAASLETIVPPPDDVTRLWVDDRHIAFLRDDRADVARIQQMQAAAVRQYTDAGYNPDAAVRAVQNDDISQLAGQHSGLFSVQLLPPDQTTGTTNDPVEG